ncbi:MAG: hypothetical protein P4L76_05305 [Beijerinckiaceae bacterium]|nr:hypothetical protein [Beijerinckiaceae bacterium]
MSEINTLSDFFVSIGMNLDRDAAKKAQQEHAAVERSLTDINAAEAAKRKKIDEKTQADRSAMRDRAGKKEEERQRASLKGIQAFALKASTAASTAFLTIEASALAVVYAVDRAAKGFERLGYVSKMSGSTSAGVSAFGYAASQLGSSRQEAETQLTAFGQKLKQYGSGYESRLKAMGIQTRDAGGHLRETFAIATDLGKWMDNSAKNGGPNGYATALRQGSMFGFTDMTAQSMMRPGFGAFESQYARDQNTVGADENKTVRAATAFEQSMRHLEEVIDQVGTKIQGVAAEKLTPVLDQLSTWFAMHGKEIADALSAIVDDFVKLASALGGELAKIDWTALITGVDGLALAFGKMQDKVGGPLGLAVALGLVVANLGALLRLGMPPWMLGLLGVGAASVSLADAAQAGFDKRWNKAAPGGNVSPEVESNQRMTVWERAKRVYRAGKRLLNRQPYQSEAIPLTGNAAIRARGSKETAARRAAAAGGSNAANLTKLTDIEATAAGIDPRIMHGIRAGESGHGGSYDVGDINNGPAYGPWQLNVGPGRLGDKFQRETGLDLRDPSTIPEQTRWVARYIARRLKADPDYNPGREWFGYHGNRDASPRWGDSGYAPLPPKLPMPMSEGNARLRPLGDTPVLQNSYQNATRGDTIVNHTPTFNVSGGDVKSNLEAARFMASRGTRDLLRNMQGSIA